MFLTETQNWGLAVLKIMWWECDFCYRYHRGHHSGNL